MPNWCRNRVTVFGNEDEVSKVKDIFESKDSVFGKIIPSPDWKNIPNEDGELPVLEDHKDADGKVMFQTSSFPKSGKQDSRWYDWNIANWDTKWDITGGVEIDEQDTEQIEINFSTAWSPPESICSASLYLVLAHKLILIVESWSFVNGTKCLMITTPPLVFYFVP